MKEKSEVKVFRLNDYQVPYFLITHIELQVDLSQAPVQVKSRLTIKANPECKNIPQNLVLDGENMNVLSIKLDGHVLRDQEHYTLTENSLTIHHVPLDQTFYLETGAQLGINTTLFGLYKTEGIYLVKAETQGMRRFIFCKDRPDVLSTYQTTIIANENEFPVLLSNGQLIKEEKLSENIKAVTWLDKTPKPTYLFALVAGDLEMVSTPFVTKSGHELNIDFFVNKDSIHKCNFAKSVLQEAMRWDEKTYGLECELSRHMVAGVNKYASGASEPTGLNLFNTEYLFASPEVKTDADFLTIANVVSHEYFHYWTGDRVTIRDWHNLAWKEGLTTFRAAEFCEDLFGRDLMRILKGKTLDATVSRPDSYTAVRSLYTAAAYEKSAEIFRMIKTVLGDERFYHGMNHFLRENDGGAITIEDLLLSLQKTSGIHLISFLPWFTEEGIPQLGITDSYDAENQQYTLHIKQSGPTDDYSARPIPLKLGLLDENGKEIVDDRTILVDQLAQDIVFNDVTSRPIPSLLRHFSAPVKLNYCHTEADLLVLMQHDSDLFNRSEAAKKIILNLIEHYCSDKKIELSPDFFATYRALLHDETINTGVLAEIISIPAENVLIDDVKTPDLDKIHEARELIVNALAAELVSDFKTCLTRINRHTLTSPSPFESFDINEANRRRLQTVCLNYLSHVEPSKTKQLALQQFGDALGNNMSETMNALTLLCEMHVPETAMALSQFYNCWSQDVSAINYWFRIQASAQSPHIVTEVRKLMQHPAFDMSNPNKLFALMRPFLKNPLGFHAASGEGYQLIAEIILALDTIMPDHGVSFAKKLVNWEPYDAKRQQLMHDRVVFLSDKVTSVGICDVIKAALEKPYKKDSGVDPSQSAAAIPVAHQMLSWMENSNAVKHTPVKTSSLNM